MESAEGFSDEVTDPLKLQRRGVAASTRISCKDCGIVLDPSGAMVRDAVHNTLEVERAGHPAPRFEIAGSGLDSMLHHWSPLAA